MRLLITGATGACARYLVPYIQKEHPDVELYGLVRNAHTRQDVPEGLIPLEGDVLDAMSVHNAVYWVVPDAVIHMACDVSKGYSTPVLSVRTMVEGTINLLKACRTVGTAAKIINVSSAEIYGDVKEQTPLLEDSPKRPLSPYAVGKLAQDALGYFYYKNYGLPVVTLRCFSYINPLHRTLFSSNMARQIAEIEVGKRDVLRHGCLDSRRCFMDVRDVVRAFWFALKWGEPGEAYNVGGDHPLRVGQLLAQMIALAKAPVRWEEDPNLLRPVDVTWQVPNTAKFRDKTGWRPLVPLEESLQGLLDHYRKEVER